jgi:RHS repeat-associated protein
MIVSGRVEYDALGRPVGEKFPTTEALNTATTLSADVDGQPAAKTSWDAADRQTSVTQPDGSTFATAYGFGDLGTGTTLFMTTRTDPREKKLVTFADVRDQVLGVDEHPDKSAPAEPPVRTRYRYDAAGQLIEVTDNGGNTTTSTYDLLGRSTSTDTPDGGLVKQDWDPAGNLTRTETPTHRAAGKAITYDYDIDRLVRADYPDVPGATGPDVTYAWGGKDAKAANGVSRIVKIHDAARFQDLTYDPLGEVATETSVMRVHNLSPETTAANTFTTSFSYDGLGRLQTLTYPDGEKLTNSFDSGGLLSSVSGSLNGVTQQYLRRLEYDKFQVPAFQEAGNGAQTTLKYFDLTRRLRQQETTTPARTVQDLNYEYDLVGNVKVYENKTPVPPSSLMGGSSRQDYEYDGFYRIAAGTKGVYNYPPTNRREYTYGVSYDTLGNVTSKKQTDDDFTTATGGTPNPVKPTTYSFDPMRYTADPPHQIAQIGPLAYKYDLDGSFLGTQDPKRKWQRRMTWDAARRARVIADGGSTTDYTYDEAGRLAIERGKSAETLYVNPWYTVRSGNVTKHVWADDERIATQQKTDLDGDGVPDRRNYFLHKDLQGSLNVATDDQGLVFQHLEYLPSGEPWIVEESNQYRTPYLFAGAYWDENRRLTDHGERWYEAREQGFYRPEPVLEERPELTVDDPSLLSAYTYAESNPLRLVDTTGGIPESVMRAKRIVAQNKVRKTHGALFVQVKGRDFRFRYDQIVDAYNRKSSRVTDWQFDLAISPRASKIAKISEMLEGRALISINVGDIDGVEGGQLDFVGSMKAIGRLFAGLGETKNVKFGLPFHKGRKKVLTSLGKRLDFQAALAGVPAHDVGGAAGPGAAPNAGASTGGAPAPPASPPPRPTKPAPASPSTGTASSKK